MQLVKAFAEFGMRYAGPKSTPWWDSNTNDAGCLMNGKLSFAIMKHTLNLFAILSRVSSSIDDRKCPIVVDVAQC